MADFLHPGQVEPPTPRMTNEDFRKLMQTPRHGPAATPAHTASTPGGGAMGAGKVPATPRSRDKGKADKRREKKTYYAKLKKDEDDKMAELAAKYRDRARERRDGGGELPPGLEDSTTGYRAVAPNARESHDAAERRRQMIHESKYLGGDMDHTHLVKGLDFALLQKVRSEIEAREEEVEEESEEEEEEEERDEKEDGGIKNRKARRKEARAAKDRFGTEAKDKEKEKDKEEKKVKKVTEVEDDEDDERRRDVACRTVLGKNIMRAVFKSEVPKVNELFLAGRMAYVMDLDEEVETDIPTTSIRSKKDVINNEQKATLSTNDIVINKLTQILTYLRAGTRSKKKKKHDMLVAGSMVEVKVEPGMERREKVVDMGISIYDDEELVKPRKEEKRDKREKERERGGGRDGERKREKERDVMGRDREEREGRDREGRDRDRERERKDDRRGREKEERPKEREKEERPKEKGRWEKREEREDKEIGTSKKPVSYFDKPIEPLEVEKKGGFSAEDKAMIKALMKKEEEQAKQKDDKKLAGLMKASDNEGYAECYPGLAEMDDALGDSDDEADFDKMDKGNKKGPMGRFDFDTQEEYASYKSQQEAMPKAAYQYGMKVSDGRKTKGKIGAKNEKAKLDKEWNKISALIDKRKSGGAAGGGGKKARYED